MAPLEGETALFVMGIFYYMRREPQGQPLSHCAARILLRVTKMLPH